MKKKIKENEYEYRRKTDANLHNVVEMMPSSNDRKFCFQLLLNSLVFSTSISITVVSFIISPSYLLRPVLFLWPVDRKKKTKQNKVSEIQANRMA